jgi:hypothetical protein
MRTNESEYKLLEVAIYDLKTENNRLRKEIDALTHTNQAISMLAGLPRADEMETLIKDGKRLDWILSGAGKYWLSSREDIDKEMEEYKQ